MLRITLTGQAQKRTVFVGLDYHQAFVQVCVMDAAGQVLSNQRCDNTAAAIRGCVERCGVLVQSAIEACNGAADLAEELVHALRHRQQQANTRRATKLRVTALLRSERVQFSGSRWTKAWIQAVRNCQDLGEQGRWIANDLLNEIDHVQRQIERTEARLEELTADDPFVKHLLGYHGVGLITGICIGFYALGLFLFWGR